MSRPLTDAEYNNGWPERPSPHFHRDEFRCKGSEYEADPCGCGGELPEWTDAHARFFDLLETLREFHGPLAVISGHRCLLHHLEDTKPKFGAHTTGLAADLAIRRGGDKMLLVAAAIGWAAVNNAGNIGIGIGARKGVSKFHVDIAEWRDGVAGWTY